MTQNYKKKNNLPNIAVTIYVRTTVIKMVLRGACIEVR